MKKKPVEYNILNRSCISDVIEKQLIFKHKIYIEKIHSY